MVSTLSHRVVPNDDVLFQEVGGEAVLLNLASESYFGLDPVGTRVWQLLSEDPSLSRAHAALLNEYEVESSRLESDLIALVDQLVRSGLARLD
jgi:hypothetical protein